MDSFSGRGSRQAAPQRESVTVRPEPVHHEQPTAHRVAPTKSRGPVKRNNVLFAVLGLLLAGLLGWAIWQFGINGGVSGAKSGQYQAVFLSNGQVYFGKLSGEGAGFYKLSDVFYLQASQQSTDAADPQKAAANSDVQLIKLGSEVHGPEDSMVIARDQVLFFENLKTDGKVAKTIADYHEKNK